MFSLLPQASPPPCGAGLAAAAPDGDLHQGLHRFPIGIPSYASDGDCNSGAPLKLDGAPSCLLYRWSLSLYPMREVPTKHDMSLPKPASLHPTLRDLSFTETCWGPLTSRNICTPVSHREVARCIGDDNVSLVVYSHLEMHRHYFALRGEELVCAREAKDGSGFISGQ